MLIETFNNDIKNWKIANPTQNLDEPKLVKLLISALKYFPNVHSYFCHQKYVKYSVNQSPNPIRKELCDMLVVMKFKNYFRYSFIQNKNVIRKGKPQQYSGLCDFKANTGQHFMLLNRPQIIINGVQSNLLSKLKYDSATAYSVFFKNQNNDYDFDFSSVLNVDTAINNARTISYPNRNKIINAHHIWQHTHFINNNPFIDYIAIKNARDIENHHEFGEVVEFTDSFDPEFVRIIRTFKLDYDAHKFFNGRLDNFDVPAKEYKFDSKNDNVCDWQIKRLLLIDLSNFKCF